MSVLPPFALARPTTVIDAVELLSFDDMPLAGGTELLLAMRMRVLRPTSLVDIKRIPDLDGISLQNDELVIGASTTHARAALDPLVRQHLPILPKVLDQVGNPRIRASGTLAGNILFAEPKSDVIPILSALDASVTLVSPSGSRTLGIGDLMLGPYYTAKEPDELLTEIRVPINRVVRAEYLKYQTQERPTVGVAALDFADGSRRIAVGAVADLTYVLDISSADTIDGFEVADDVEVIPDSAGSVRYKRHVTGVTINRAVAALDAIEAA